MSLGLSRLCLQVGYLKFSFSFSHLSAGWSRLGELQRERLQHVLDGVQVVGRRIDRWLAVGNVRRVVVAVQALAA